MKPRGQANARVPGTAQVAYVTQLAKALTAPGTKFVKTSDKTATAQLSRSACTR
jgi:hypothetical protein